MTRLNVVLLLALIVSSVYLVRISYDARQLFAALDKAQSEERQLATEFERLKTEKQSQATPSRVEKMAHEKLMMRTATPAITQYVTYAKASPASAGEAR